MVELSKEHESRCFFEKYGNDFDGYYNDPSVQKISNKAASRWRHSFSKDEIKTIQAEWLWHAIRKFDKEKFPNTKFSSYLFGQICYGFRIELKKRQKDNRMISGVTSIASEWASLHDKSTSKDRDSLGRDKPAGEWLTAKSQTGRREAREFIMDLPISVKSILEQRYIYNMTMEEIGSKNGYSRETARRKIKSAIDFCRNSD